MTTKTQIKNIATSTKIFPRYMHLFLSSFKPQFEIPIKKNEIRTLIELYRKPNRPMKYYVDAVDMESGSFTYLVDKLEKKGLVKRIASEEDKRKTVLQLTEEGNKIALQIGNDLNKHIMKIMSVLDEQDLIDLQDSINSLERIYTKLQSI